MFRYTTAIYCCLLLSACTRTNETVKTADTDNGKLPRAVMKQTEYNFGSMKIGEKGEHSFTLWNRGNASLLLASGSAQSHVSCRIEEDTSIEPGNSLNLLVKWYIPEYQKEVQYERELQILTNDRNSKAIVLVIRGKVE